MTEEVKTEATEEVETEATEQVETETKPSRKPRGRKPPKPKLNEDGLPIGEQVDFDTILKVERKRKSKTESE